MLKFKSLGQRMKNIDHIRIALAISAAMLIGLLPLPYGFYTLLRIATFAGSIYFAFLLWEQERYLGYALAFAALLFNPIWPIELDRGIWAFFNAAGTGLFAVVAWKFYTSNSAEPKSVDDQQSS